MLATPTFLGRELAEMAGRTFNDIVDGWLCRAQEILLRTWVCLCRWMAGRGSIEVGNGKDAWGRATSGEWWVQGEQRQKA
jgi:hypothetical protein